MWLLPLLFIMSCSTPDPKMGTDESTARETVEQESEPAPPPPPAFILGPGDEITVNVWRSEELSRNVMIDPSGNIYLPLAGKVPASGLTLLQLRDAVASRLSKYLINPQVDVNVSVLRSQNVYVLGEVISPGPLSLETRMVVWEAIAKAGGFTDDANQQNVLLVRAEQEETTVTNLNLQLGKKLSNGNFPNNFYMQNRDIIYVAPRTIASVETFLRRFNNIIAPFISVERAIVLGPQVWDALQGKTAGDVIVPP